MATTSQVSLTTVTRTAPPRWGGPSTNGGGHASGMLGEDAPYAAGAHHWPPFRQRRRPDRWRTLRPRPCPAGARAVGCFQAGDVTLQMQQLPRGAAGAAFGPGGKEGGLQPRAAREARVAAFVAASHHTTDRASDAMVDPLLSRAAIAATTAAAAAADRAIPLPEGWRRVGEQILGAEPGSCYLYEPTGETTWLRPDVGPRSMGDPEAIAAAADAAAVTADVVARGPSYLPPPAATLLPLLLSPPAGALFEIGRLHTPSAAPPPPSAAAALPPPTGAAALPPPAATAALSPPPAVVLSDSAGAAMTSTTRTMGSRGALKTPALIGNHNNSDERLQLRAARHASRACLANEPQSLVSPA